MSDETIFSRAIPGLNTYLELNRQGRNWARRRVRLHALRGFRIVIVSPGDRDSILLTQRAHPAAERAAVVLADLVAARVGPAIAARQLGELLLDERQIARPGGRLQPQR